MSEPPHNQPGDSHPINDSSDHEEIATSNDRTQTNAIKNLGILSKHLSTQKSNESVPCEINFEEFDYEAILSTYRNSSEKLGLKSSSAGVAFRNLTVRGYDVSTKYGPSVSELIRSIVTFPIKLFKRKKTPLKKIIQNVNGVVKSGEMLLVIGRPGAGCSTLLRTISGETAGFKSVEGDISYDGLNQADMLKNFKGYVIYNPELEFHFPHLNVRETLEFAVAIKTPRIRPEGISRKKYIETARDVLAAIFGLRHTYKTKVGNDFIRGISGGERKRVSLAEALATSASIYSWDNATRGLDASTALEFVRAIRTTTNLLKISSLIAIYQAGEHIYDVFDKVTVLYFGRQIYFGPASRAKEYFIEMGWECPPRMTTGEFLTSVTDLNGRTAREGFKDKVPRTPEDFVAYWYNSVDFQNCISEYNDYIEKYDNDITYKRLQEAKKQRQMKHQRSSSNYILSYPVQVKYLIKRGFQRVKGDSTFAIISLVLFTAQALVVGSLYFKIPDSTAGAYSRGGVLFFSLLFNSLAHLAEVSNSFAQRPIVLKQKSYSMYHPSAEALQNVISQLPLSTLNITIFGVIIYFMTNLKLEVGAFFIYYLFLNLASIAINGLFQTLASLCRAIAIANSIAGICVLILAIYTGYMIPFPYMHPWFKWLSYLDPLRYAYESMMSSEFHGRKMTCVNLVPSGPGYESVSINNQVCTFLGSVPGQPFILGDDYVRLNFQYSYSHVWRNFGIMIGWVFFYITMNTIATEYARTTEPEGDVLLFKRNYVPEEIHLEDVTISAEEMKKCLSEECDHSSNEEANIDSRKIFSWRNLNYVIPAGNEKVKLLSNVDGFVKPGTITALMGESGAGKTTLLNVLSQRTSFGVITGDILVGGSPTGLSFQRNTGYVQQQDLHLFESTVREALRFSAELRQPKSVPIAEKHEYVENIIRLLGMEDYAESFIGNVGKGLNVEQRKKLSIGVELVAKPSLLLFLDEPTSGLDSHSAWSIVQFLRTLADSGQAILCTIHQPSATLFEVFDRLLLLEKGGKTVYFGDIGKNSETLLDYFEKRSPVKCGAGDNPAEYILECIGAGTTIRTTEDWADLWTNSKERADLLEELRLLKNVPVDGYKVTSDNEQTSKFAVGYWQQLATVFNRTRLQFWRRPDYIAAKFSLSILGSLFIGFTFWQVNDTIQGAQNSVFAVFILQILSVPLINQIQSFAFKSRELFEVRESASNTFHWSTLLLSQLAWEYIYSVVSNGIAYCCFYFPVGFNRDANIAGYFYLVYGLIFPAYFVSFGLLIIYSSPDVPSAAMINSFMFTFMISFCGVVQPYTQMPGFWTFMYKVSPLTYFIQAHLGSVVHNKPIICAQKEYNIFIPPTGQTCAEFADAYIQRAGGYLANPNATTDCQYCAYTVADEFVARFGVRYDQRWRNVGFFFAYILFNLVAMLLLFFLFRVFDWSTFNFRNFKAKFTKKKVQEEDSS